MKVASLRQRNSCLLLWNGLIGYFNDKLYLIIIYSPCFITRSLNLGHIWFPCQLLVSLMRSSFRCRIERVRIQPESWPKGIPATHLHCFVSTISAIWCSRIFSTRCSSSSQGSPSCNDWWVLSSSLANSPIHLHVSARVSACLQSQLLY